jgi:hypothetical protein
MTYADCSHDRLKDSEKTNRFDNHRMCWEDNECKFETVKTTDPHTIYADCSHDRLKDSEKTNRFDNPRIAQSSDKPADPS